jgi:hypothetical protein
MHDSPPPISSWRIFCLFVALVLLGAMLFACLIFFLWGPP